MWVKISGHVEGLRSPRLGMARRGRPRTTDYATIAKLYALGWRQVAIAERLGCSPQTVNSALTRTIRPYFEQVADNRRLLVAGMGSLVRGLLGAGTAQVRALLED